MKKIQRKTKGVPDLIDKHVGQRLRARRTLLGISQEKLAESVGITFQQIQKYERGTNRISASRLLNFSKILQVEVAYFFQNLEAASEGSESSTPAPKMSDQNIMDKKETLVLVRTYYSVSDPKVRKNILKFIKSMAEGVG